MSSNIGIIHPSEAKGEDGRRNKFLLPSPLRLDERSSSPKLRSLCFLDFIF